MNKFIALKLNIFKILKLHISMHDGECLNAVNLKMAQISYLIIPHRLAEKEITERKKKKDLQMMFVKSAMA